MYRKGQGQGGETKGEETKEEWVQGAGEVPICGGGGLEE